MKKVNINAIGILFLIFISCSFRNEKKGVSNAADSSISYGVTLKLIASGLEGPIGMAVPADKSGRLFVVEQAGTVRIIKNGQLLTTPFINISSKLDKLSGSYSEKGLLGMACHPDFKTNGKFYLYYSAPPFQKNMDNTSIIAEYTGSPNADLATNSERILFKIDEPESNHNGGQLVFGPDGYLYAGVGDGGGAGDHHGSTGNGQNINTLLGKILRIDINAATGPVAPGDNPFVNKSGQDEIFAYGLRNPWRFSFDRTTGRLFCADVGQNDYEEVDIIERGKNYGWRIMEGSHCYNPSHNCNTQGLIFPIHEYDHTVGKSIIGGFVYRGTKYPEMEGKYIFGDWTGKIFVLVQQPATGSWERRDLAIASADLKNNFYINSFGEDENGELYVLGQNGIGPKKSGVVYRLEFN
ncbi:MAG: PQQ-dependent sugar dehydrogenase [Chitinophagales bacterium]|nr:PQQ-dependent sugar dehydrogenase [Chitinophagales bacterium]